MVSPSLSATLVAIATIINCSDSFVTPKLSSPPSINNVASRGVGVSGNTLELLPQSSSCNIFSSKPQLLVCLLTSSSPPPLTTTSLYSTQHQQQQEEEASSSTGTDDDGDETLQTLFSTYSDTNGLMSKDQLLNVPSIKDMLAEGDLLSSEFDEIWDAAKKSSSSSNDDNDSIRIDVDSFIQVYRDIDDLFEDDGDGDASVDDDDDDATTTLASVSAALAATSDGDEAELSQAFDTLKDGDDSDTISFAQLRQWEEITSLVNEGMLGEDEFQSLWESSGTGDDMDLGRFLMFNNALDDLFVLDEEEEEEDEVDDISSDMAEEEEGEETEDEEDKVQQQQLPMITETDLPPAVLFSQLANENYLVGQAEIKRWGELQEMIFAGDLSQEELDVLVGRVEKAPGTDMYLNEEGFCKLAEAIDDLFEEVDDDGADEPEQQQQEDFRELREELLELLEDIDKIGEEEGRLLCGLDCNELEQERVLEVVGELEREAYNKVVSVSASGGGAVSNEALLGEWKLLYSSSSTMKYNEGLSGLAGGLTRFGGLQQKIIGTKYLSDVEYTEQVIAKLGGKSFEVKITGDWELRTETSLFTGKPANVMSVTPDNVTYGTRRDKADHWKSLGPMNMLLLTYVDEDLRIMRGNTSTDTLFIWKRC